MSEAAREVEEIEELEIRETPYDLSKATDSAEVERLEDDETKHYISEVCGLDEYLSVGTPSRICFKNIQVFNNEEDEDRPLLLYPDGIIDYVCLSNGFDYSISTLDADAMKKSAASKEVLGVVISSEKRPASLKKMKHLVLRNGDEDYNDLVNSIHSDHPTISYNCLARFFQPENKTDVAKIATLVANGTLQLIDFNPDERKDLTKEQKNQLKRYKAAGKTSATARPPKGPQGFTLVGTEWHRSATVVIRDTRKDGFSILMGQDEDMYFGCELPGHPASVGEAYEMLIPPEARVPGVTRQGEWFAVPVKEKDVPKITEAVAISDTEIDLPVDHEDANRHTLSSSDIRVSKDGVIYSNGALVQHSSYDHGDMKVSGWVKFVRNTAVRSFSVKGVD